MSIDDRDIRAVQWWLEDSENEDTPELFRRLGSAHRRMQSAINTTEAGDRLGQPSRIQRNALLDAGRQLVEALDAFVFYGKETVEAEAGDGLRVFQ